MTFTWPTWLTSLTDIDGVDMFFLFLLILALGWIGYERNWFNLSGRTRILKEMGRWKKQWDELQVKEAAKAATPPSIPVPAAPTTAVDQTALLKLRKQQFDQGLLTQSQYDQAVADILKTG